MKFCKLSCCRRCTAPLPQLIQNFGNNCWNLINFRYRNAGFQVLALFWYCCTYGPNSWGRNSSEGAETCSCRCAVEIILLRQFIWNLYSAGVGADIGIPLICECWFSDMNSVYQPTASAKTVNSGPVWDCSTIQKWIWIWDQLLKFRRRTWDPF